MRDKTVWYTIDNLHGDSWSDDLDTFVDEEDGGAEKYDDADEAIETAKNLWRRGERNHVVTEHVVRRDGVEHTYPHWEA